jgi:hypothetical protein
MKRTSNRWLTWPLVVVSGVIGSKLPPVLGVAHSADANRSAGLATNGDVVLAPPDATQDTAQPLRSESGSAPGLSRLATSRPHTLHWPEPESMWKQLEELMADPELRPWVQRVEVCFRRIVRSEQSTGDDVTASIYELSHLVEEARGMSVSLPPGGMRAELLRAAYAIERRVAVWQAAQSASSQTHFFISDESPYAHRRRCLERVEKALRQADDAEYLSELLQLAKLREVLLHAEEASPSQPLQAILTRLDAALMNDPKATTLTQSPYRDLLSEMRRCAAQPLDYASLLRLVERYEAKGQYEDGVALAHACQQLRWQGNAAATLMGLELESHYRNANLRLVVSGELVNRLLPGERSFDEAVDERIVGARVFGNARTSAQLRARLLPDQSRWRVGLEVEGEVESETMATRGPATFLNEGLARYQARKTLLFDRLGMRTRATEVEADSETALRDVQTSVDRVPLIGWVARSIAIQQHAEQSAAARWEIAARLRQRTRQKLDAEVEKELDQLQADLDRRLLTPLREIQLGFEPLELQTTDEHLIGRYRLAAPHQLAAFTPRPREPEDSLVCVQVHDSLVNNTIRQLELDNKRVDLREFLQDLSRRFTGSEATLPEEMPERVTIHFAPKNAVRVQFENGRVVFTLGILELKSRRNSWREFAVRVYYRPEQNGTKLEMRREEVIELMGARLKLRDQVALRLIFAAVFSDDEPISLIDPAIMKRDGLKDLQVKQFEIQDGWVSVALGASEHVARTNATTAR